MKVVSCKKCGAKYQLDDNNNIDAYECSSCTGSLELFENYPSSSGSSNVNKNLFKNQDDSQNFELVYCVKCGLKHIFNLDEDITDYKCSSCYSDLQYLDKNFNKKLIQDNQYLNDKNKINHIDNERKNTIYDEDSSKNKKSYGNSISNDNSYLNEIELKQATNLRIYLKTEFLKNAKESFIKQKTSMNPKNENILNEKNNGKKLSKRKRKKLSKSKNKN